MVILELLCFCDLVIGFFKAYKPEGQVHYVTELMKVALNNLHSDRFKFDLITFIPWGALMFTQADGKRELLRLLWLIKVLRIKKIYALLDRSQISQLVHGKARDNLEKLVEEEAQMTPDEIYDVRYKDLIKVNYVIYGIYAGKILKLAVSFVLIAYFVGLLWIINAKIFQEEIYGKDDEMFFVQYVKQPGLEYVFISSCYWALTTLSTVGFGDMVPRTNYERATGVIIIFCGYLTFSYVNSCLLEAIEDLESAQAEFDDGEKLEQFFQTLKTVFNAGVDLDKELRDDITDFFQHKWRNNKNQFQQNKVDAMLLDQMPMEARIRLYQEFIFRDFLVDFRRLFRIRKDFGAPLSSNESAYDAESMNHNKKYSFTRFKKYPFHELNDHGQYANFMLQLLGSLETRVFKPKQMLLNELDIADEFYFV